MKNKNNLPFTVINIEFILIKKLTNKEDYNINIKFILYKKMIDIVVTVDENYMQHLNVMLVSLFSNTKVKIVLHCIISDDVSNISLEKLRKVILQNNSILNIYNSESSNELFEFLKKLKINFHFKYTMYFRLFLDKILPKNIEKILYLDPDIIVNDDIENLYKIYLENFYLGAIEEDFENNNKKRLKIENKNYYNSGVLLINLKLWRENDISNKILHFIKNLDFEKILYPDQDIINLFFKDYEIKKLDPKWNIHAEYLILNNYYVEDFKIMHFSGSNKPWNYSCLHPYKNYYFKYLLISEYRNFEYKDKTFINFFKKYLKKLLGQKI